MMDAETLLKITNKVMEEISECISTDDEYYKIVGYNRQMGITRKMDLIAEEGLQRELVDHGICARIVSEELGDRVFPLDHEEPPQCTIVFDPVDGSTNAVHGIPFFCTSLAYSSKTDRVTFDDIDVGVVATISGKTYHAVRGEGAYINGIRIENRRAHVGKPIISLYTYGASWIPDGIKKLEQEAIIRILGSIATEICMVAEGATDGVVDVRNTINRYDIAASYLILRESGGTFTDLKGEGINKEVTTTNISFVCTMLPSLHDRIMNMLLKS